MKITLEGERANMDKGKWAIVRLDGEILISCIEADTDAGYVIETLLEKHSSGLGYTAKGRRRRYGVVTISYKYLEAA
jgi:hypothetical protein